MGLRSEGFWRIISEPGRSPLTPPPNIPRPSQLQTSHGRPKPKFSRSELRLHTSLPRLGPFCYLSVREGSDQSQGLGTTPGVSKGVPGRPGGVPDGPRPRAPRRRARGAPRGHRAHRLPPPPPLCNRRGARRRSQRVEDSAAPRPRPFARGARVLPGVTQPSPGPGRRAALLTRAGQCG